MLGQFEGTWYTQQYNIEKGETAGLESTFGMPLTDSLGFSGNLTYMIESKNKTTGNRLSMTPKLTANASLNWNVNDKLNTFLSAQYIGKQLYSPAPDASGNVATGFAKSNYTFDIGATYDVNKNLSLRAGIQNFTNSIAKTNDDFGDGNPRRFYAGLTARF